MVAHIPVLLHPVLQYLQPNNGGHYVDMTFGGGGYSRAILQAGCGRLDAFDRDETTQETASVLMSMYPQFHFHRGCYSESENALHAFKGRIDGIVFDLGISSMQVDQAHRGFSFMRNGPLDMRMDQTTGQTAADVVNTAEGKDLFNIFRNYGEEPRAKQFARAIMKLRAVTPITTTKQLADCIADLCPIPTRTHPATRVFQALRIYVNQELERLKIALNMAFDLLKYGGKLIVVTFHSLEDRIVKSFFANYAKPISINRYNPMLMSEVVPLSATLLTKAPITPTDEEINNNNRARSAKMRVMQKNQPLQQNQ